MKIVNHIILLLSLVLSQQALANRFENIEITVTKANGNVYMLKGAGGNIGLLATEQGLLLVDDQFEPLAEKIEQAMKSVIDQPLKYVVNTHYHGDHTGANSYFSHKAPIFAHKNVRKRLDGNAKVKKDALPVVTYQQGVEIHLSDEKIVLTHLPTGHTDSDTIVYFKNANVLHTGDLFFEIGFPYVDINGGGNVKGYLKNVNYILSNFPDDVVIIPGHGKMTDKAGLQAFADMIDFSIRHVSKALKEGKSEQQILSEGLGEQYQHLSWQFINEEKWLKTLVTDLK